MGKTLAIADVRREIKQAISKLRILPSDTIAVLPGDHPMKPSVIAGPPGGPVQGPTSSVENAIPVWASTTGDLLKQPVPNPGSVAIEIDDNRVLSNVRVIRGSSDPPFPLFVEIVGDSGLALSTDNITSGPLSPGDITVFAGSALDGGFETFGADIILRPGKGTRVGAAEDGVVEIRDADDNVIFTTGTAPGEPISLFEELELDKIIGTTLIYGAGFDGGGSTIAAGTEIEVRVEQGFLITGWFIIADQSGDIQIDIWRDTFANYPPTPADSITAGNEPAISSADKGDDQVLTGWDTTVNDGDILKFVVDSATTITRMSIYLIGTRT